MILILFRYGLDEMLFSYSKHSCPYNSEIVGRQKKEPFHAFLKKAHSCVFVFLSFKNNHISGFMCLATKEGLTIT